MNPKIIFLTALRAKKFTPAMPGHAEEISLKIIPGTPDPVLGQGLPLSVFFVMNHKKYGAAFVYSKPRPAMSVSERL